MPWYLDVAGLVWVLGAAVALLLPALTRGVYLGPFDWLAANGLPPHAGAPVHNIFDADQITQMIPWTNLAWTQVHHGHLPLWNPYSALGTTLAFNWQSAVFSLPALIGYLVPLRFDYTVQVFVTLFVTGSGVYVFGRVVRLSIVACVFGAVAAELGGTFVRWLGWPVASVMSWTGWALVAIVLIVRGGRRVRAITFFSVVLALAVYAGQPDTLILFGVFLVLFTLAFLGARAWTARSVSWLGRPLLDLGLAFVTGIALSAPLLLPGLVVLSKSVRSIGGSALSGQHSLPLNWLPPVIFPGIDSLPLVWFQNYLGVVPVALALVAVVMAFRARARGQLHAATVALTVTAAVFWLMTFVEPVDAALIRLPLVEAVRFPRAVTFFEFAIALLAAIGLHHLTTAFSRRSVLVISGVVFGGIGVGLLVIWLVQPGGDSARTQGFLWASGATVLGLAVIGSLAYVRHRSPGGRTPGSDGEVPNAGETATPPGREGGGVSGQRGAGWKGPRVAGTCAGALLLVFETVFLVAVGGRLLSSSPTPPVPTQAVSELSRTVGTSLVGVGQPWCADLPALGLPPNTNILFGLHELTDYDPLFPRAYFTSWSSLTGRSPGAPAFSLYCPGIRTVSEARLYGVSFVLERHGSPGPVGATLVEEVGGQDLYRIPGVSVATLVPVATPGRFPPENARGAAVSVRHVTPSSLAMTTDGTGPHVLRVRLDVSSGWHATIDGRPLTLTPFAGVMVQASIPSGKHVIECKYWPTSFTAGIALAIAGVLGLVVSAIVARARRTRRLAPERSAR